MQRVTNCILLNDNQILLIKKPSRGWYAIPGGKMEQGETIQESVTREYWEETALNIHDPALAGVFTFSILKDGTTIQEWMMFTFICFTFDGNLPSYCEEGELEWVPIENIYTLPMAEGDKEIFKQILAHKTIIYGAFSYTEDYKLLDQRLNPS